MSESTKERLAKLIIAAERKHEETDEQDRLLDIADALLAAGVTLPEPEPEWRVRKGTSRARWFVDRWDGQNEHILFFGPTAEADAREYVARKLAKPLDVEALADTCRAALGIKDSVRTLLPEGRTNWCNGIRRVLELAQVGALLEAAEWVRARQSCVEPREIQERLGPAIKQARKALDTASSEGERAELVAAKDRAYRERNQLAILLASMTGGTLGWHEGAPEKGWERVLFINLPSGQVSFHVHASEVPEVLACPLIRQAETKWDGHTDPEKWARVTIFSRRAATEARGSEPGGGA